MAEEEIDIFIVDEEDKKYLLEIPPNIKYMDLAKKIESSLKKYFFDIRYKNELFNEQSKNKMIKFEQGDTVHLVSNRCDIEAVSDNIQENITPTQRNMTKENLSGILRLFLLKYITIKFEDFQAIKSEEIKKIISYIKYRFDCGDQPNENIKMSIGDKSGKNIMSYSKYIENLITDKVINDLIGLLGEKEQEEIKSFWSVLSSYNDNSESFEKIFMRALERSYFDYSLIGVSLYGQLNKQNYVKNLFECPQSEIKILFTIPQLDNTSNKINKKIVYSRYPLYGMGVYFTQMIDSIPLNSEKYNINKNIPINSTFYSIAVEVYFSKKLKKYINDTKYNVEELDHFPNYEEIKRKYQDKAVEKNGVHLAKVELNIGQLKNTKEATEKKQKGKFVDTEYVITEQDQILPIFGLTLKRNEYFIVWRDNNFKGFNVFSEYLKNLKNITHEFSQFNSYFVDSTEKALDIIKRKKFNKIILISSIGLDLSGKRFVEIARKILGFEVVVLFFSANKSHLSWIQNFPNALFTNELGFYKDYIMNYNEKGLLALKKKTEEKYKVKLKFTDKYFEFPKFINEKDYKDLIFEESSEYFKKVIIKSTDNKTILKIDKKGNLSFIKHEGKVSDSLLWYVTIFNNEITFYSNDFYLGLSKDQKTICGQEFMKGWKYKKNGDKYSFYLDEKLLLTESDSKLIFKEEQKNKVNQQFRLIEMYEV
jgi:hypothetical protein